MKKHTSVMIFVSCVILFSLTATDSDAIPLYTMAAANECDTCHIEPIGWMNPDMSERRCTLDCSGCHVSNAGGGMRLADGKYFGKEVLPIFGTRPSSLADPMKYLSKGFPTEGRWDWTEGWRGWWPGKVKHTTITERYGDIDPKPKWDLGGDFRAAFLTQSGNPDSPFVFPMQADLYFLNESVRDLQVYVAAGLQGKKNTDAYSADETSFDDYVAVKELFLKYRGSHNTWFRIGRFVPRFGWRTPDHTAYARQVLGFNQNFQGTGIDIGYNPNYFYADASIYFTGLNWPGDHLKPGLASTANIGYRTFGWNAGASFHHSDENDSPDGTNKGMSKYTAGINGSLNFNPFIYYGEIDLRYSKNQSSPDDGIYSLVASHEFNYTIMQGIYGKFKYDYADTNLGFKDDHGHRLAIGADIHPYTHTHFEIVYQLGFGPISPITSITDSNVSELILISHVWF